MATKRKKELSSLGLLFGHAGDQSSVGERIGGILTSPLLLSSLHLLFGEGGKQLSGATDAMKQGLAFGQQRRAMQAEEEERMRQTAMTEALASQVAAGGAPQPIPGQQPPAGPPQSTGMPPELAGPPTMGQMRPPTSPPMPDAGQRIAQSGASKPKIRDIANILMTQGSPEQQMQGISMLSHMQDQAAAQDARALAYERNMQAKGFDAKLKELDREDRQKFQRQERYGKQRYASTEAEKAAKRDLSMQTLQMAAAQDMQQLRGHQASARQQQKLAFDDYKIKRERKAQLVAGLSSAERSQMKIDELVSKAQSLGQGPVISQIQQFAESVNPWSKGDYEQFAQVIATNVHSMMDVLRGLGQMSNAELKILIDAVPTATSPDAAIFDWARRAYEMTTVSYGKAAAEAETFGLADEATKFKQLAKAAQSTAARMRMLADAER